MQNTSSVFTRPSVMRKLWRAAIGGAIALAMAFTSTNAVAQTGTHPGKVGFGLEGLGGRGQEFVDVAKTARDWSGVSGGSVGKDASGWPTGDFETVLFDARPVAAWVNQIDDPTQYQINMAGTYKMRFTGQATVSVIEGSATVENPIYNSSTNTTTADLVNTGAIVVLRFTGTKRTSSSASGSGITNLKVTRPGYAIDTNQTFHTPFLNTLNSANIGAIRFMDWVHANNTNPVYPGTTPWSARPKVSDAIWHGAPWEICIALGNQRGRDIWINIPVAATDDYITKLAQLVRYGSDGVNPYTSAVSNPIWPPLNSNLNVYVEYNNEVWNWGFTQSVWNNEAGKAAGRNYIKQYAHRTAQIAQLWRTVWGSLNGRVRVVNCWQIGWNPPDGQYEEQMQYINGAFGAPSTLLWGVGVAPYFNEGSVVAGETVTQILDQMQASSDSSKSARQLVKNVANKWSVRLLCYEAGPDNGGGDTTNIANRIAANRNSRMGDLIRRDLNTNWFAIGGDLYVYFTMTSGYNRYGCWGATDDVTNPDRNYKFQAIRDVTGAGGGVISPPPPPPPPSTPPPPPPPTATALNADIVSGTATVDGNVDSSYSPTAYALAKTSGTVSSASDASASFRSLWDSSNLHVLIEVTDDNKSNDSTNAWDDDSVEIYIDGGNNKTTSYDTNDRQIVLGWGDTSPIEGAGRSITGVTFAKADPSSTQYRIEARIPWSVVGQTASPNKAIGLDVHVNDDDAGGTRDGKLMWNDGTDGAWGNPSLFGTGTLKSTVAPPAAPTGLIATAGNAQVALSWSAVSGATGYKVYGTSGGNFNLLSSPTSTSYTHTGLINGTTYSYYVTATNSGGEGSPSTTVQATPSGGTPPPPPPPPPPSTGGGDGLKGEYFNNMTLSGTPALTKTDTTVNFSWTGSPATGINADGFSVRWSGYVLAPTTGTYTFQTESDDGVRVYLTIGDAIATLVNNWTNHAPTVNNSSGVTLAAGTKYQVRMEFYENTGGAVARLRWITPGSTSAVAIPQTNLFSTASTSGIQRASTAPTIDGTVDFSYTTTPWQVTKTGGTISSSSDASATFRAQWDATNLYVLVQVTDDNKSNDSTNPWEDDSVELYLDGNNNKTASYDANDRQIVLGWNDTAAVEGGGRSITGVTFAKSDPSTTAYNIEVKVPWSALGVSSVSAGKQLGIDVHVNDDDAGGARDGKLMWNDATDGAWGNPSLFGTLALQ